MNMTAGGRTAFGPTGYGSSTFVYAQTLGGSGAFTIGNCSPYYGSGGFNLTKPANNYLTVNASINNTNPNFSITAAPGNSSVVAWMNSSDYPTYAIYNTVPIYLSNIITSGSSVSASVPVYPGPTSASPAVSNAVLVGVANTTTAASGSGSITTNGSATLNSNYGTSANQTFDNQIPNGTAVQGVKGSISGRNVTLFGNN